METKNIDFDISTAKRIKRRRNRKKLSLRICKGFANIGEKPWKCLFVATTVLIMSVIWTYIDKALSLINIDIPLFPQVAGWITSALMAIIFFLPTFAMIMLLGTPRNARRIEDRLYMAFERNDLAINGCPILVSCEKIKGSKIFILDFYSMGIALRRWEELQNEIEDALNVCLVEPIQYRGNNRNRILLYCSHGVKPSERGDLIE
ncbi:MAG: hypothetical protein FWD48_09025 [Oscillospiraceae bacterium]|nr:hypothetical protein [Oscillospiraceae bacterium]